VIISLSFLPKIQSTFLSIKKNYYFWFWYFASFFWNRNVKIKKFKQKIKLNNIIHSISKIYNKSIKKWTNSSFWPLLWSLPLHSLSINLLSVKLLTDNWKPSIGPSPLVEMVNGTFKNWLSVQPQLETPTIPSMS